MAGKLEMLNNLLAKLTAIQGVTGAVVASRGGLVIASKVPAGAHEETFSAMCATIVGASVAAAQEFKKPEPRHVIVDLGGAGTILLAGAGPKALLVVIIGEGAAYDKPLASVLDLRDEVKEIVR